MVSGDGETLSAEQRFRLLVENVRDYAIFMLDVRGHVATWNIGAQRIKGYAPHEIIGQHFSKFYPDEDILAGKPARELEEASRDGRLEDEGWRIRKDGSRFWANVVITAVHDDQGQLVGFAKITRDLTERRRAEDARVRLAEEKAAHDAEREARRVAERLQVELATTLRSIGDAVIVTDSRGTITMMNPVAESLTGWAEADARGRPAVDVFRIADEATHATVTSPIDKVLELGSIAGLADHTLLVRRDGSEIPIDDSGAPIRLGTGPIEGVVLVFRDITDRTRDERQRTFLSDASAALAESLEYATTVARVAQLAVPTLADWCAVDILQPGSERTKRLAVAHADPAKVKLVQELDARYPPAPDAQRGVPSVLRTGLAELHPDIPDEVLVAHAVDADHLKIARELGPRSAILAPLVARGRVMGVMTFALADSRRRYTQRDLALASELAQRCAFAIDNASLYGSAQEARRGAEEANRTKDEFLAIVSHELRTPLTSILGYANFLTRAPTTDQERIARVLDTIRRNAEAMSQLIEDLLDMSRIISGKMRLDVQPVDVMSVVEGAIDSLGPAVIANDIAVDRMFQDALPALEGDATRLQQVVWNLLSNAVKFTPRGGKIDVVLRLSGTNIEIRVSDTGKGIAPGFLPYVFDLFRQEEGGFKRSRGGLGLGLAITRRLVELHGGQIHAHSEGEGRGATFTVLLPTAAGRPLRELQSMPGRQIRAHGTLPRPSELLGRRVLVVEDEPDAREFVKDVLEQAGCVVSPAPSVDAALALFAQRIPDLVISDIGMPGRDGFDLIRAIRELPRSQGGEVPAAALTAYARAEDRRAILGAGFSTYVAKPVDPAELIAVAASLTRFAR